MQLCQEHSSAREPLATAAALGPSSARPTCGALLGLAEDPRQPVRRRELQTAVSQRSPRLLNLRELPGVRAHQLLSRIDLVQAVPPLSKSKLGIP